MDSEGSGDKETAKHSGTEAFPDSAAVEEVQYSPGEPVTYFIVEGSSQRQRPKLIDSKGYSYTKYSSNKDGSITWRCRRVRNREFFCSTTVKQVGDDFFPSAKAHGHPCTPGEHVTAQIVSQVKRKAADSLFEPADQIVNEVLIDNISSGNPMDALPNPRNLARLANRLRRKQAPKTLVLDLTHSARTEEDDAVSDTASCYEDEAEAAEETAAGTPSSSGRPGPVGTQFSTYEDIERFVREHEEAHFVKFYKMNSRTVESSRKRLPTRFLSDHLRYASVLFACIHHGKHRSTSKGLRPRQKTLRMGCPAKFRFSATPDGNQFVLSHAVMEHSHPHDEDSFRSLPQKRRLTESEREEACHILEKRSKKSAQKLFQEKTGKVLTMRDLHNLAATSKQQTVCYTNIQAILDYLSQVEDQTSVVEVVTKADGRIVGIYFQDKEMKRVYAAYPQYLVLDAACKYNSLRMPLYVMLMEDGNGDSEIIGVFLVILSNTDSIRSMLLRFKEHNPAWSELQVIMADKDFAERPLLQEEFPNTSVQICLSHVLRRFQQDISKHKLGLQREETSHLLKLMRRLAASKSEAAYMERYKLLLSTGLRGAIEYYNNTWHSNRQEWVEGLKARSLTLKRDPPDKLDAVNQLLKSVFKSSPSAEQVIGNVKKVIELLREERDHTAAALLVQDLPPTSSKLREFEEYVTPFALKYILRQMKLSWKVHVKASVSSKSSTVKSSRGKLTVYVDSCPCRFWRSLCLPCRHIFGIRRTKNLPLFAKEAIGSRWTLEHYRSSCRFSSQESSPGPDALSRKRLLLLSRQEKYDRISKITKELATAVSEAPAERFGGQVKAVQDLLSLFRNGSSALITEVPELPEQAAEPPPASTLEDLGDATLDEAGVPGEQAQDAAKVAFQTADQV